MNEHIDDLAELYALGVLSDDERSAVDAHLAQCAACSTRVAQSEAVIAALVDAGVPKETAPPQLAARIARSAAAGSPAGPLWSSLRVLVGLAAALVLGLGLAVLQVSRQNHDLRVALAGDERAFSTITHSHFHHTEFSKLNPDSPSAKVLYAHDGSWFYVIIDGAHRDLHVIGETNGSTHDYGVASVHGHTTTLFTDAANHVAKIELREGPNVIGVAAPQY